MRTLAPLLLACALAACAGAPAANGLAPARCEALNASLAQRDSGDDDRDLVPAEEPPRMLNPGRVQRSLADSAEWVLRDTVTRVVGLRYLVMREGSAAQVAVVRPSGNAEFDAAAAWALGQARFEPARINGCAVTVWIEQELTGHTRRPRRAPAPESGVQGPPRT